MGPCCNAVLSSGTAFAVTPENTASTMAWCAKSFVRSSGPGSVQEIVEGNGSGGNPGTDGRPIGRVPTLAAYSSADTDRAVIFPIRRSAASPSRPCLVLDRARVSGAHGGQRDRRDGGEPSPPDDGQVVLREIARARDRAELVTDDAQALKERLEAVTGERISALEGIGEKVEHERERDGKGPSTAKCRTARGPGRPRRTRKSSPSSRATRRPSPSRRPAASRSKWTWGCRTGTSLPRSRRWLAPGSRGAARGPMAGRASGKP